MFQGEAGDGGAGQGAQSQSQAALPVHLLERFLQNLVRHFGPPRTSMSTVEAKPVTASDDKLRALVEERMTR